MFEKSYVLLYTMVYGPPWIGDSIVGHTEQGMAPGV